MIIALIGEKLSGKDTVSDYLIENHKAEEIKMSDVIRQILTILNIPITRDNITQLVTCLRQVFGEGVVMKAIEQKIRTSQAELILINGVRFQEEVDFLRTLGAKVVYITAPLDIRYQRFMSRRENADDGKQSETEFLTQENSPTEKHIGTLGKQADIKIENTGTLADLQQKIDVILK